MMAYNTHAYFIYFLPLVMIAYQLIPKKYRWGVLLVASTVFFTLISKFLILWAVLATLITGCAGIRMETILSRKAENKKEKNANKKKAARVLFFAIFAVAAILLVLKYSDFVVPSAPHFMVPIGISFYTLQAIGYLLDVYWKHIEAEKNPAKLMLFMIFFPTLMEGPIMRWDDVKEQLYQGEAITGENLWQGFLRISYGMFKRLMISDRMNTMVVAFYDEGKSFSGVMVFLGAVITTIQLYLEFSGTIDIVIGSARIFGIRLPENFRQPFYAKSAAEFWRRWHITLGVWFKNYIFYPVTTSKLVKKWNKFGRKKCGKYITNVVTSAMALFPVWMLNGFWHGPRWPYILYGVYYFIILLLEVMMEPVGKFLRKIVHMKDDGRAAATIHMLRTWIIIFLGEMLFRVNAPGQFRDLMVSMFRHPLLGGLQHGSMMELGLKTSDLIVVVIGIVITILVDMASEKNPNFFENTISYPKYQRVAIAYLLVMVIAIFGAYGTGYDPVALIYAGF